MTSWTHGTLFHHGATTSWEWIVSNWSNFKLRVPSRNEVFSSSRPRNTAGGHLRGMERHVGLYKGSKVSHDAHICRDQFREWGSLT